MLLAVCSYGPLRRAVFPPIACFNRAEGLSLTEPDEHLSARQEIGGKGKWMTGADGKQCRVDVRVPDSRPSTRAEEIAQLA